MVAQIYAERIQNVDLATECPANRSQSALNVSTFGKLGTNDARVSLQGKDGHNEMVAMEGSIYPSIIRSNSYSGSEYLLREMLRRQIAVFQERLNAAVQKDSSGDTVCTELTRI